MIPQKIYCGHSQKTGWIVSKGQNNANVFAASWAPNTGSSEAYDKCRDANAESGTEIATITWTDLRPTAFPTNTPTTATPTTATPTHTPTTATPTTATPTETPTTATPTTATPTETPTTA